MSQTSIRYAATLVSERLTDKEARALRTLLLAELGELPDDQRHVPELCLKATRAAAELRRAKAEARGTSEGSRAVANARNRLSRAVSGLRLALADDAAVSFRSSKVTESHDAELASTCRILANELAPGLRKRKRKKVEERAQHRMPRSTDAEAAWPPARKVSRFY